MSKELGEYLSRNFISKVGKNINITSHCWQRIKERTTMWVDGNLAKSVWNVNYAITHCRYGYNNDDGTISIVMENDLTFILTYKDNIKKWNVITIKDKSENGFSANEKHCFAQRRNFNRYYVDEDIAKEKCKRFREKKNKTKYKRSNNWKGEEW